MSLTLDILNNLNLKYQRFALSSWKDIGIIADLGLWPRLKSLSSATANTTFKKKIFFQNFNCLLDIRIIVHSISVSFDSAVLKLL